MSFQPVELKHKEIIERYTRCSNICNCDLSFANMYCWQATFSTAWDIIDGFLIIRFRIDGQEKLGYMQPLRCDNEHDFSSIIPILARDAHQNGERLRIIGLTDQGREIIQNSHPDAFAFHSLRGQEDYIYSRTALEQLRGRAYQAKRNHINQFQRLYKYDYQPLTPQHFSDCLELCSKWAERHDVTPEEQDSIERAFENFEELGLRGGVIIIEGRVAAFTYGSAISHTIFCTHAEKCDTQYTGIYATINALFTASLPPQYTLINREEDMGIEGLRTAKLSYHPTTLQKKYTAIHLHSHESACRKLWRTVFCDEDEFIDHFLMHHFSQRGMVSITDPTDGCLAMLHIIPMTSDIGRVAYIYGVATHPEHRRLGYATKLMSSAMERISREDYAAAVLIPNEEWLIEYYSQFGFERGGEVTFNTHDDFDFGTGQKERDIYMMCPLFSTAVGDKLTLASI